MGALPRKDKVSIIHAFANASYDGDPLPDVGTRLNDPQFCTSDVLDQCLWMRFGMLPDFRICNLSIVPQEFREQACAHAEKALKADKDWRHQLHKHAKYVFEERFEDAQAYAERLGYKRNLPTRKRKEPDTPLKSTLGDLAKYAGKLQHKLAKAAMATKTLQHMAAMATKAQQSQEAPADNVGCIGQISDVPQWHADNRQGCKDWQGREDGWAEGWQGREDWQGRVDVWGEDWQDWQGLEDTKWRGFGEAGRHQDTAPKWQGTWWGDKSFWSQRHSPHCAAQQWQAGQTHDNHRECLADKLWEEASQGNWDDGGCYSLGKVGVHGRGCARGVSVDPAQDQSLGGSTEVVAPCGQFSLKGGSSEPQAKASSPTQAAATGSSEALPDPDIEAFRQAQVEQHELLSRLLTNATVSQGMSEMVC